MFFRSFQNYTDYFKCVAAKGDDFVPCKQFKKAYHSLCPSTSRARRVHEHSLTLAYPRRRMGEHRTFLLSYCVTDSHQIGKWDEQRDSGTFPASLEP